MLYSSIQSFDSTRGVLIDTAQGMFTTDTIYSDFDIPKLESLPMTQPHRSVDLTLITADSEGDAVYYCTSKFIY